MCEMERQSIHFPRVLLIDMTRMGHISATGQVKQTLFMDYPQENIMQVFSAGTNQVGIYRPTHNPSEEIIAIDSVLEYCHIFDPEVIYYRPVGGKKWLHDLAIQLIDNLDVPFVIHIMDDWIERLRYQGRANYEQLDRSLRELFARAAKLLSISDAMSTAYQLRYGYDFVPIANCIQPAEWPTAKQKRSTDQPFVLRYSGALADDMSFASIMDIAQVVHELQGEMDCKFEISTMPHWKDKALQCSEKFDGVSVHEPQSIEGYRRSIIEADAVCIAYNFDEESIRYTRYSMANKMPECMASGTPILAYGAPEIATIAYLKETESAHVISRRSIEDLKNAIRALVSSPEYCFDLGEKAQKWIFRERDCTTMCNTFHGILIDAAAQRNQKKEISLEDEKNPTQTAKNRNSIAMTDLFFVLGNGPSMKDFDFDLLSDVSTVGLNVAYRHWERINWYPDYYCCMDTVVIESHKEAIYNLIKNRLSNGIKKFFLRKQILDTYPELADLTEVFILEHEKENYPFLDIKTITTGSFSALLGVMLGYKEIRLLGIDLDYIEIVDGAKRLEGIQLEITETPDNNPNYFFDDYQQKGDRYNIPNPRPSLHEEAWVKLKERLQALNPNVRIINCNPVSRLTIFPFQPLSDALSGIEFNPEYHFAAELPRKPVSFQKIGGGSYLLP
jgi:glycosyltransferase involved in cell wall biosynthesis